jgi:tetratricopeptide (TPR) repeat protein
MPVPNSYPMRVPHVPGYVRQSYVEKDRVVRNSTAAPMPGVDCMLDFQLSKKEFENVFNQAAERVEANKAHPTAAPPSTPASRSGRLGRLRHRNNAAPRAPLAVSPLSHDNVVRAMRGQVPVAASGAAAKAERPTPAGDREFRGAGGRPPLAGVPLTAVPGFPAERPLETPFDAERYADACRRMAAQLQRSSPPDFDGAGELFERAVDARTRFGLFCCTSNADAHVEYAQNLSKRGLTPEAEYHLRTAADIFRLLDARAARKYGDVLLYIAVVVDRQGRLAEAENFYRSALGVYRANKLSDDNVRVAIDSLSNNLRAQGRGEEVDTVIQRHFLGAPERL